MAQGVRQKDKGANLLLGDVMRLLLVEDDEKIASFIIKGFKAEGFAVDHAGDGQNGLHLALTEPYDAAIIDIMLPELDGLAVIKHMRHEKIKTPVIVLSAKGSVDDRVKGLQTGGEPKHFRVARRIIVAGRILLPMATQKVDTGNSRFHHAAQGRREHLLPLEPHGTLSQDTILAKCHLRIDQ